MCLLEKVVAIREEVLAEEHPSRLASQHTLAMEYQADGQVERAIELREYEVVVKAHVYRADYPSRLVSIQVLKSMHVWQRAGEICPQR